MTVVVKPSNDSNSKKSSFTFLISFIVNNSYTRAFFTMCMLFMYGYKYAYNMQPIDKTCSFS